MLHLVHDFAALRRCSVPWITLFFSLSMIFTIYAAPAPYKMAIIDTGFHNKLIYKTFTEIARHAGFEVTILTLDELIDLDLSTFDCANYEIMLFALEEECVAQLSTSPLAKRVLELVHRHAQIPQAITGFMLPSSGRFAYKNIKGHPFTAYQSLVEQLGFSFDASGHLGFTPQKINSINPLPMLGYKMALEQTLYNPFGPIGSYATTLKVAPQSQLRTQRPAATSPIGITAKNPSTNHFLLLGNAAIFSFSSVSEIFHICPVDDATRQQIHNYIYQGLIGCAQMLDTAYHPTYKRTLGQLPVLKAQTPEPIPLMSRIKGFMHFKNKSSDLQNTAWMDIEIFQTADNKIAQERLIGYIVRGNFDALWLSISPNQYFSSRAKFKDRMPQLEASITRFSKQLVAACSTQKKLVPKIIISFEITNNFVEANKYAQPCAQDLYGNSFADVPAPLDRTWWHDEVITSAEKFVALWNKKAPKLKLNGFVLDLEMYLRNESKVSEFVSTSIGSPSDLSFLKDQPALTINDFAQSLIREKKGVAYLQYLTNQAEELGKWMRISLQKIIPNALVACYAANVSLDWMYQGLYRGISSSHEPLMLFSFNSRWDIHKKDVANIGLNIQHSAVALLSQIQTHADFGYFKMLRERNDGIWLNKLCRLSHEYQPNEWHRAEQTPISFSDRGLLMDFVAQLPSAQK
jgi:hypothetical protein